MTGDSPKGMRNLFAVMFAGPEWIWRDLAVLDGGVAPPRGIIEDMQRIKNLNGYDLGLGAQEKRHFPSGSVAGFVA